MLGVLFAFQAACGLAQQGDAARAGARFDVLEYVIEGNSKLVDMVIERAVSPHMGEAKSVGDVEAARAALEAAYHDAGYLTVVVSIPEQEVAGGTVTLAVTEGAVDRLRVRGAEYTPVGDIKARVPELAEGNVPYFPQYQREMEALNRGARLKATPVLKPGRAPGAVAVDLEVEDSLPVGASLELNNRQSPNTTPLRLAANLRYDNLFQRNHSIALTLQGSPQAWSEVRVAALTYVMPVGNAGHALAAYAVSSNSALASLGGVAGLGLAGDTTIAGLRYAMPLPSAGTYLHSWSFGADYKNVKQLTNINGVPGVATPITYAVAVANYNGGWRGDGRSTQIDAAATLGLGTYGKGTGEYLALRGVGTATDTGASANFITVRGGLKHVETLGRFSLSSRFDLHLASAPLVPTEQFFGGGVDSVRGYREGQRLGDAGWRYSIELRSPPLPVPQGSGFKATALLFADGATLRTFEPSPPTPNITPSFRPLRSTGFGLRLVAPRGFSLDIDVARALSNDLDIVPRPIQTHAGDIHVHFRLSWEL